MKLAQKGIVIAGLYQDIGSSILDATIYVSLFGQLYLIVNLKDHYFMGFVLIGVGGKNSKTLVEDNILWATISDRSILDGIIGPIYSKQCYLSFKGAIILRIQITSALLLGQINNEY